MTTEHSSFLEVLWDLGTLHLSPSLAELTLFSGCWPQTQSDMPFSSVLVLDEGRKEGSNCDRPYPFQEILALKNESRILGLWSNSGPGSKKSQASSPWATQHRV